MPVGGSIQGTVTSLSGGTPIANVEVVAESTTLGNEGYAITSPTGTYDIIGLPTSSYSMTFYPEATNYVSATATVSVTAGQSTTENMKLQTGSTVSGTVTNVATNQPVSGAEIYLSSTGYDGYATTSSNGTYSVIGLPSGSYTAEFLATDYATQWYQNETSQAAANAITVGTATTSTGINAALVPAASISGTVTDDTTNQPVGEITVEAFQGSTLVGSALTQSNGTYTVLDLAPGSYTVEFAPQGYGSQYATQWWNDVSSQSQASAVALTAGQQLLSINAALEELGSITGTVTAATGGAPLSDICVDVFLASDIYDSVSDSCSETNGNYLVTGLATGTYVVEFTDPNGNYSQQWYNGAATAESASPIEISTGNQTTGVNAAMATAGKISGTVTDTSSDPLSDVCVYAYSVSTDQYSNGACTNSQGGYSIGGLVPGSYLVYFSSNGNYLSEWYNNQTSESSANPLTVVAAQVTQANAVLQAGGTVSGTVEDATTSAPLADICVDVYGVNGTTSSGYSCTNSSGNYSIGGLETGSYQVYFYDPDNVYESQYYNGQVLSQNANTVSVAAPQTTTGINAKMSKGQLEVVSGTVTDATSGDPLSGVCVDVGQGGFGGPIGCSPTVTDSNGTYSVSLPAGSYEFAFADPTGGYIVDQVPVTVSTAPVTQNAALTVGATISGLTTDEANNAPLSQICPVVFSHQTQQEIPFYQSCTGQDGTYTTGGLPAGTYDVELTNPSGLFIDQWYQDQSSEATATGVAVSGQQQKQNINASMTLGGNMTGTVTSAATGKPLGDICVTIYTAATGAVAADAGCTASNGTYTAPGLPPGNYDVLFSDPTQQYAAQWYDGATSRSSAQAVTVTSGTTQAGIGAALDAFSGASGGTVSLSATTGFVGHSTVTVSGKKWSVNGDTSVTVYECASQSYAADVCDQSNALSKAVKSTGAFKGVAFKLAAGAIASDGAGCGVAGDGSCYLVVVGSTGDETASTALGFTVPKVKLKEASGVTNGTNDVVKATGFPLSDHIEAEECDASVFPPYDLGTNCDAATAITGAVSATGTATFKPKGIKMLVGSGYSDSAGGTCDPGGSCVVVVFDESNDTVFATASAGLS